MTSKYNNSMALYAKAHELFPYGTQLFSRKPELGPFGQAPIYYERAKNAHFWDVDGNEFIDMAMGIGPVLLGYCYDSVDSAVIEQISKGVICSVNNSLEIETANLITEMVPCAEMVKFCKSGGEADAIAVRIARGYTGKEVVLFCGYHGWHDWYLSANLESETTLNSHLRPGISPKGVPASLAGTAIPFEYNNLEDLDKVFTQYKNQVACIIMEATRHQHPKPGFLASVRKLADKHNCLLIFDEVITGFRMARGGAQEYYGVEPDIATFAKAMANGYPLAAVVGKKNIMASQSDNFISSTYWSDTVSLAAGLATLQEIKNNPVINTIESVGNRIMTGLKQMAEKHNVKMKVGGHPFTPTATFDYAQNSNKITTLFMQEMVDQGIYGTSCMYSCYTHTDEDIKKIIEASDKALAVISDSISKNCIDKMLKCPERQVSFKRMV